MTVVIVSDHYLQWNGGLIALVLLLCTLDVACLCLLACCSNYLLLDASYDEERVMEGQMIIAMNKHREICALHMSGTHLLLKSQVTNFRVESAV